VTRFITLAPIFSDLSPLELRIFLKKYYFKIKGNNHRKSQLKSTYLPIKMKNFSLLILKPTNFSSVTIINLRLRKTSKS
jgi:hypothetical protein